jgi:HK97 family phage major capsid protein
MTPEEKVAHDALILEVQKKINEGLENKADLKSITDLENVFKVYKEATEKTTVTKEELETIKASLINVEAIVKAMKEDAKSPTAKGDLRSSLEANKSALSALKAGGKRENMSGFTIEVNKAVGTMLESTNISGGNVTVEQRISGMNAIASRRLRLMDLFTKAVATSNIISWVYQSGKEGAAGGTAEGALKNQIDFNLVVASQVVVKRTAFIKVSDEMIDDIDFINSEINNELMRELMKDIELTAYSGNGTAPNLNGVRTVATAFAAGSFALAIDNANQVDVLTVAVNQILIAEQPMPNAILMHPTDVTKLKVTKVSSTDKRYVERLEMIAGSLSMDGIPIIPTTLVTVDNYLVGSFDLATLYEKGSLSIEVGLDADDFTKNLRTIRAEWRGALVVKNNDRTAFVKGVFATDMAALETA